MSARAGPRTTDATRSPHRRLLPRRHALRSAHAPPRPSTDRRSPASSARFLTTDPEPAHRLNPGLSRDQEVVLATALEKQPAAPVRRPHSTSRKTWLERGRGAGCGRARSDRCAASPRGPSGTRVRPAITAAVGLALTTGLIVALLLLADVRAARDDEAATARHARARALASASVEAQRRDATLALLLARAAVRAERTARDGDPAPRGGSRQSRAGPPGGPRRRDHRRRGERGRGPWSPPPAETAAPGSSGPTARCSRSYLRPTKTLRAASASRCRRRAPTWRRRGRTGRARLWSVDGTAIGDLSEPDAPALACRFLDDDSVATVGRHHVAVHDARGALRRSLRLPGEPTPRVRTIGATQQPPALHLLLDDGVAISYDRDGETLSMRKQGTDAERVMLVDAGYLAVRPSGTEPWQLFDIDGKAVPTPPVSFGNGVTFCAGDRWWCAWSLDTGAIVERHIGGTTSRTVLDMQRSARPATARGSWHGGRIVTVRSLRPGQGDDKAATGSGAHLDDAGLIAGRPVQYRGSRLRRSACRPMDVGPFSDGTPEDLPPCTPRRRRSWRLACLVGGNTPTARSPCSRPTARTWSMRTTSTISACSATTAASGRASGSAARAFASSASSRAGGGSSPQRWTAPGGSTTWTGTSCGGCRRRHRSARPSGWATTARS